MKQGWWILALALAGAATARAESPVPSTTYTRTLLRAADAAAARAALDLTQTNAGFGSNIVAAIAAGQALNATNPVPAWITTASNALYATVSKIEVNIKDFGATGGGTNATADTLAWERAADFLRTNYGAGTIFLPAPGVYTVTNHYPPDTSPQWIRGWKIFSNLRIRGDGPLSVIKVATNVSGGVPMLTNHETNGTFYGNIILENLTLDGSVWERISNGTITSSPGESEGVSAKGGTNWIMDRVVFKNLGQTAVDVDTGYLIGASNKLYTSCSFLSNYDAPAHEGVANVTYFRCYFWSNGFGQYVNDSSAVASRSGEIGLYDTCIFEDNKSDFRIAGGLLTVRNCLFIYNRAVTNIVCTSESTPIIGQGGSFIGNRAFLNTAGSAFAYLTNGSSAFVFIGNEIANTGNNGYGIIASGSGDLTIQNNLIRCQGSGSTPIFVTGNHASSKRTTIAGNTIVNVANVPSISLVTTTNAIVSYNNLDGGYVQLSTAADFNDVVGNVTIANGGSVGMRFITSKTNNIVGNVLHGAPLLITGGSTGNRVYNNVAPSLVIGADYGAAGNVLSENHATLGTINGTQVWVIDPTGTNSYLSQLRADTLIGATVVSSNGLTLPALAAAPALAINNHASVFSEGTNLFFVQRDGAGVNSTNLLHADNDTHYFRDDFPSILYQSPAPAYGVSTLDWSWGITSGGGSSVPSLRPTGGGRTGIEIRTHATSPASNDVCWLTWPIASAYNTYPLPRVTSRNSETVFVFKIPDTNAVVMSLGYWGLGGSNPDSRAQDTTLANGQTFIGYDSRLTNKFRFYITGSGSTVAGTSSIVVQQDKWYRAKIIGNGSTAVLFQINNEAPVTVTHDSAVNFNTPMMMVGTTSGVQKMLSVDLFTLRYAESRY